MATPAPPIPVARGPTETNSRAIACAGTVRPTNIATARNNRTYDIVGQLLASRGTSMSLLDEIALVKDRWSYPLGKFGGLASNVLALSRRGVCDSSFTRFDRPAYGRPGRLGRTVCRYE